MAGMVDVLCGARGDTGPSAPSPSSHIHRHGLSLSICICLSSPQNVHFRSLLKVYSLCIKEELKIARGFFEFNLVIYNTTPLEEE
jgi:hypothetical protein